MQKHRVVAVAAAAALTLGMSACSSEEGTASKAEEVSTSSEAPSQDMDDETETETSTSTESSDSPENSSSADITEPGTELEIGETATVPFEYAGTKSGTIAITVTAIKKGKESDLEKYGDQAKGLIPYFIKYKVENVSGTDLSGAAPNLRAVTENGSGTGVVISGGVPGKCESEYADDDFNTKGATFESCELSAARSALDVTGVEFNEGDKYRDDAIVWTK